jgi:SAM-dependent methyltransferase
MSELLKNIFSKLRSTPIHPQWFAFFREERHLHEACMGLHGVVLDVGCADGRPRRHLSADARYVGLDFFSTAKQWYGTRPDVYADAQLLPLANASIDHSLLLDVLEHIPHPDRCLSELHRVLKPGGTLRIQVPFLYPLHDVPLDFNRWTRFGLQRAAHKYGFEVVDIVAIGHPLETAALNANIALSKTVVNWLRRKNPLALLGALLPIVVPLINCLARGLAALDGNEELMPYSYRTVWVKK